MSDLLGIPRPTLYRYLREYSIPRLRREGRIQIPEDSFDRIREARDLHKEGLGTETVRRQLREGTKPDTDELDRRLDGLHQTLRGLRGDLRGKPAAEEVALSPTLRTILARQSLMLSAMFNLTGMVEDLLLANGKPRRVLFDDGQTVQTTTLERVPATDRGQLPAPPAPTPAPAREVAAPPRAELSRPGGSAKFGALGRRRRRGALAILASLLVCSGLAFFLPGLPGTGAGGSETARSADARGGAANAPVQNGATGRQDGAGGADREASSGGGTGSGTRPDAPAGEQTGATTVPDPARAEDPGSIPDVAGRGLEGAAREIRAAGFSVAAVETVPGRGEPGTVAGTEPAAGTDAAPDAPVTLIAGASATASVSATASASVLTRAPSSASASASSPPGP